MAGYSVCVVDPALECAQSDGFVSFDHPDSSDTKGGQFKKLQPIPGPLRCFLLGVGSSEQTLGAACSDGKALANHRSWGAPRLPPGVWAAKEAI